MMPARIVGTACIVMTIFSASGLFASGLFTSAWAQGSGSLLGGRQPGWSGDGMGRPYNGALNTPAPQPSENGIGGSLLGGRQPGWNGDGMGRGGNQNGGGSYGNGSSGSGSYGNQKRY